MSSERKAIRVVEPGPAEPGTPASGCSARGGVRSRRHGPQDERLWLFESELEAGAELVFEGERSDQALYVVEGGLETDGRLCPAEGAIILESGASPVVRARSAARVLHFGAESPIASAGDPAPGQIHVVGPGGTFAERDDQRDTRFYADSTCPSCDLFLLYTSRRFAYRNEPHSHSADELIHLLWGSIRVGGHRLGPGASVFVRADQAYGFQSGPEGFGFLNYRQGPSVMTFASTGRTLIEGGRSTGMPEIGDLR